MAEGNLNDDGLGGDKKLGDKEFTLQKIFNESATGEIFFQISVVFRGQTKVSSNVFKLLVSPGRDPEQVINEIVVDLRTGEIEAALQKISLTSGKALNFRKHNADFFKRLADGIASRRLEKIIDESTRFYKFEWLNDVGKKEESEFFLSRDFTGNWYLSGW